MGYTHLLKAIYIANIRAGIAIVWPMRGAEAGHRTGESDATDGPTNRCGVLVPKSPATHEPIQIVWQQWQARMNN